MTAKNFVLVHGAWHGGWCWARVAERLRAAGHRVFTPTMTGLGERAHLLTPAVGLDTWIADAAGVIEAEELSDVVSPKPQNPKLFKGIFILNYGIASTTRHIRYGRSTRLKWTPRWTLKRTARWTWQSTNGNDRDGMDCRLNSDIFEWIFGLPLPS